MSISFLKSIRFPRKHSATLEPSDERLILHIQRGDVQAWATFLNRYTHVIYQKACAYSRTNRMGITPEDREDEAANLYLFMASYLKQSLKSYQGKCKPSTWVLGIIGNRPRILKAYLLHKDPCRSDVRLPKILATCSQTDQEIFKRLVWGFDPAYIAQDLHLSEDRCYEIENLVKENSPRVYDRIRANRAAKSCHLRRDVAKEANMHTPCAEVPDQKPNPEYMLISRELQCQVQTAVSEGIEAMSIAERRILILLYNENLKPAEIVQLAKSDTHLGLNEAIKLNRIYYVKDQALNKICERILHRLETQQAICILKEKKRNVLTEVETYLTECGLPASI